MKIFAGLWRKNERFNLKYRLKLSKPDCNGKRPIFSGLVMESRASFNQVLQNRALQKNLFSYKIDAYLPNPPFNENLTFV